VVREIALGGTGIARALRHSFLNVVSLCRRGLKTFPLKKVHHNDTTDTEYLFFRPGVLRVLMVHLILKPDYEVAERETYHFRAEDGSVFIVQPGGLFSSAKRQYVEGPRKGQAEEITDAEVEQHRKQAEAEFGKNIPGSLFGEPRFIPGKQRSSLPLIIYKYGIPHEAGWIDEKGVHHYSVPRPLPV
jgi:hypothetical protein